MIFYTCFKYSILSILKSKTFILVNSIFLSLMVVLNLSFGLYIKISEKEMAQLFVLEYINVILIMIEIVVLSLLFSNEFFYNQKRNGIKTIEVKNGMKVWQIFCSKLIALILMILAVSFVLSSVIVIENLIIFNENIYVTKLIFVNLYLVFLVPLFLFSLNLLILSLNIQKVSLIFSSFFLGLLSVFHFFNAAVYDYESYNPASIGSNNAEISSYRIYFNYYIQKFKHENEHENEFLLNLKDFNDKNLDLKKVLYYEGNESFDCNGNNFDKGELSCDMKEYYNYFLNNNSFYRSGNLFYNIDLFNSFNKTFLANKEDYRELVYDKEIIEKNSLFNELQNFDIKKSDYDLFEDNNYLLKSVSLLKELQLYISELEKHFKNSEEFNFYYNDLKKINKVILDIYQKGFYFKNEDYFLYNDLGLISSEMKQYFSDIFGKESTRIDKRKIIFELQEISSGKSLYQGILFYIINNYDEDKLFLSSNQKPNDYIPGFFGMSNYYTSPFLWLEFITKFGLVEKNYDNIATINTSHFIHTNNFIKIKYDIFQDEDTGKERYIIHDYSYKGPNTVLLIFLILIYCTLLILLSYLFYKINFYK
ncbi:hypothetical protein [Spiroplasma endosymbiont of Dioctria linearis]|uniref:hypothetical protein n=1 Tax=Spiroplasma endosymbiont of Dioctria linearis TaxID=3066290 RepID=UPI00313E4B96